MLKCMSKLKVRIFFTIYKCSQVSILLKKQYVWYWPKWKLRSNPRTYVWLVYRNQLTFITCLFMLLKMGPKLWWKGLLFRIWSMRTRIQSKLQLQGMHAPEYTYMQSLVDQISKDHFDITNQNIPAPVLQL